MVSYYFALVEINQNSCCKFTDIFLIEKLTKSKRLDMIDQMDYGESMGIT